MFVFSPLQEIDSRKAPTCLFLVDLEWGVIDELRIYYLLSGRYSVINGLKLIKETVIFLFLKNSRAISSTSR